MLLSHPTKKDTEFPCLCYLNLNAEVCLVIFLWFNLVNIKESKLYNNTIPRM